MNIKKKRKSWSHLNTPDDFNKFIEENNVKNPIDLHKRFCSVYNRATTNKLLSKLIYPERRNDWSHLNTIEDFNKFIEENNIQNPTDFEKRFRGVFSRVEKLKIRNKLFYPNKLNDWSHLNTIEDFNKFIKENDIKSPVDFETKFSGIYDRAGKLKIRNKLSYPKRKRSWDHFNSINDFNKFIKENDIKNPTDFGKKFRGVYKRAGKLKILNKLSFPNKLNNWNHLNTIEDFNKFIEENDIKCPNDFKINFISVYSKASKMKILNKLVYCKGGRKNESSWEKELYSIIKNDSNFINLQKQAKFSDCINKYELPFDITFSLLNGKLVIIEVQGPVHYATIHNERSFIRTRKNDIIKNKWARKKKNIHLFYFSKPNKHLNNNCYPYYIYTSIKELLNDIKKLI